DRQDNDRVESPAPRKRCRRRAADAHHHPTRFHALETPHQRVTPRAVQHYVTILGHVFKTRAAIINGDVRAQALHQLYITLANRSENSCAQMTGQLDRHASDATAARMNQHPLVRSEEHTSELQSHLNLV